MDARRSLVALMLLALSFADLRATDLTKVDRTIAKEPAYRHKPKYCLLVFGPEAKSRVWLVQDGDTLYVDRNGNGDLTEPGAKIAAQKRKGRGEGEFTFTVPEIRVGERLHKKLSVNVVQLETWADDEQVKAFLANNPKAIGYHLSIDMDMPGRKGTAIGGRVSQGTFFLDVSGVLQFADNPKNAPIVHLDGPLSVTLFSKHKLTIDRDSEVTLGVGTRGVGPGTTAYIEYEGVIPEKLYPTLELTYPPAKPGAEPIREKIELKGRC
jgi:hypothetical protein